MQTLDALQRRERAIAAVRAAAGVFAVAQTLLYEPPTPELAAAAAAARPVAIAWGVAFIAISGVAELTVRTVRNATTLHHAGLGLLALDIVAALGLVATFAFDPVSATWTLLTVIPLIGAARFQLVGALATWAAVAVGYVTIALLSPTPVVLSSLTFRVGLLLVIATFAGVAMAQLERQREVLARLDSASRGLIGRLDRAEILQQTCREAVRCADAASGVLYAADGPRLRPVAAWPPDALPDVVADPEAGDLGDVEAWRDGPRHLHRDGVVELAVPLRHSDTDHVLVVRPRRRRGLGPAGEQAVLAVADSAGVALAASTVVDAEHRATRRLEQLEALRTRFVAAVAHDLRRPLTVIGGLASLLARGPDAVPRDRLDALVADVQRQANRLNRLADDLLDAARAQDEQLRLRLQPTRVGDVVRAAAADADEPLDVDVDDGLVVHADPARLERVLWNLLSNAEKYGKPPFAVRARAEDGWVRLEVRDHGPGLATEQQARLAEEFTAGDDPASVGLGLAIVWRLIEAHGGRVRYEAADPGACFQLWLPAADEGS